MRAGPEAASAAGPRGSAARAGPTELAARVEAIRLPAVAAALPARGIGDIAARLHGLAAGALGGELAADFGVLVRDLLGPAAAVGAGAAGGAGVPDIERVPGFPELPSLPGLPGRTGSAGEVILGPGPCGSAAAAFGGPGDLHRGLLARALGLPVRV
ncbi:hypothetical protein [Embleya sp. NPDC005971]|uniref:hypothetical protein n=1 Tax=Embleya sp. NPDC005971 TaxID=3156724 RepID=UPI0033D0C994